MEGNMESGLHDVDACGPNLEGPKAAKRMLFGFVHIKPLTGFMQWVQDSGCAKDNPKWQKFLCDS